MTPTPDHANRRQASPHGPRPAPTPSATACLRTAVLPRLLGFLLALVVMGVLLLAFDRFLASMQRFLAAADRRSPAVDGDAGTCAESVPAYVVPVEPEVRPKPRRPKPRRRIEVRARFSRLLQSARPGGRDPRPSRLRWRHLREPLPDQPDVLTLLPAISLRGGRTVAGTRAARSARRTRPPAVRCARRA